MMIVRKPLSRSAEIIDGLRELEKGLVRKGGKKRGGTGQTSGLADAPPQGRRIPPLESCEPFDPLSGVCGAP